MSFSSRRRNYLLTPHRRDGLIEWMKSMLQHSFVLDALETTGADTFSHFEILIDEHREKMQNHNSDGHNDSSLPPSRLKQLVPTIGTFHTRLPLRDAFTIYNTKHKLTNRKHIQISFNEIRHILNLAQIMAMRTKLDVGAVTSTNSNGKRESSIMESLFKSESNLHVPSISSEDGDNEDDNNKNKETNSLTKEQESLQVKKKDGLTNLPFNGPKLITFDGDQTLYTDGTNFESNPRLANYLYQLLKHGVIVAVVTAAGYEYKVEKYEYRLSGLLSYFQKRGLTPTECESFYLFGGECNYLVRLGSDYKLHAVKEDGPGGWFTCTKFLRESPANWSEKDVQALLDTSEASFNACIKDLNLERATRVIRKKRGLGLIPSSSNITLPREALDETVLRTQGQLDQNLKITLPYCAFNGGRDVWVDVGNKRVGVQVLQSYLGVSAQDTLHIGDQFLNTGNDYAARDVCPCIWITSPEETTYILKSILRLAGISVNNVDSSPEGANKKAKLSLDFSEVSRRSTAAQQMDVYTGDVVGGVVKETAGATTPSAKPSTMATASTPVTAEQKTK